MALQKKPCSVCRRWFFPNPRVGERQRTCGDPACVAGQRRRTQAAWRAHNPDYWAERRLREQLERRLDVVDGAQDVIVARPAGAAAAAASAAPSAKPPVIRPPPAALSKVPWDLAQDAFGAKGVVLIGFLLRLGLQGTQDAMRTHVAEMQAELRRLRPLAAQDAIDRDVADAHAPP